MSSLPEPTLQAILEAVHHLSGSIDGISARLGGLERRFDGLEVRLDGLGTRMGVLESNMVKLDTRMGGLEHSMRELTERHEDLHEAVQLFSANTDKQFGEVRKRVDPLETTMVTKEYLDDKLFALRADLIQLAHRTSRRLEQLIEDLVAEKSLKRSTADRILAAT